MPKVLVVGAGWSPDGQRLVHGLAGAWPDSTAPGGFSISVLLGAGPALCQDENLVRAVLVHEFAHCFKVATIIVDHLDLGTSLDGLGGSSWDPNREHRLLARPSEWFGPDDVELLSWGDGRMGPMTDEVHLLVRSGQLRGEGLPIHAPASFNVPDEWKRHIRSIRSSG
jgi:hypothetical protein